MAHSWLIHGSLVAHLWLIHGSFMAHSWLIYGSFMAHSRLIHGSNNKVFLMYSHNDCEAMFKVVEEFFDLEVKQI